MKLPCHLAPTALDPSVDAFRGVGILNESPGIAFASDELPKLLRSCDDGGGAAIVDTDGSNNHDASMCISRRVSSTYCSYPCQHADQEQVRQAWASQGLVPAWPQRLSALSHWARSASPQAPPMVEWPGWPPSVHY